MIIHAFSYENSLASTGLPVEVFAPNRLYLLIYSYFIIN